MARDHTPQTPTRRPTLERLLEAGLFQARWLMGPFYLGLVLALVALLVAFIREVGHELAHVMTMSSDEVVVLSLTLIDMSLAGNLLLIVIFAYLLYTRVRIDRFPPTVLGKVSTILQVVTLSFVIAANTPIRFIVEPMVRPFFWITIALTLYSGWDYMRRADRQLHALRGELV